MILTSFSKFCFLSIKGPAELSGVYGGGVSVSVIITGMESGEILITLRTVEEVLIYI